MVAFHFSWGKCVSYPKKSGWPHNLNWNKILKKKVCFAVFLKVVMFLMAVSLCVFVTLELFNALSFTYEVVWNHEKLPVVKIFVRIWDKMPCWRYEFSLTVRSFSCLCIVVFADSIPFWHDPGQRSDAVSCVTSRDRAWQDQWRWILIIVALSPKFQEQEPVGLSLFL